ILYDRGTYYWYGENKDGKTTNNGGLNRVGVIGISCYSSKDLYNWKNEGVVLPAVQDDPHSELHTSKVLERPKVLFNTSTRRYVMWMHVDTCDYQYARAGVAIASEPCGPFRYLGSLQPNGADSRDMTVFQDRDGKAYLIFSSEWNKSMHVVLLDEEYLHPSPVEARILAGMQREAPAIFRNGNRYYLITSGCTGWDPNAAQYAIAPAPLGPWTTTGNPCVGENAELTFYGQGSFMLPVAGKENAFLFMADLWKKDDLRDSRYAWLPVQFRDGDGGEELFIEWLASWDLSFFDR
ncbi:MAG: glycoside hydrolase family 43 protein, partial [Omnitrophica WOR_2 bacterium]